MSHWISRVGRRLSALALVAVLGAVALVATSFAGTSTPAVALGDVPMTTALKRDLGSLPGITPYAAFVHFRGGSVAEQRALVEAHGLVVTETFPSVDVVFAVGTVAEIRGLTREPAVTYLEDNRRLQYFGDTAVWATRARVTQENVSGGPYRDAVGRVVDGTGVGVAVVDSGILATHPDLTHRVAKNFKIVCSTPALVDTATEQCFGPLEFVDVGSQGSSDTSSGHGTHVSGIIAGDGTASTGAYPGAAPNVRGTFTGVAPGATLYGFGTGEAIVVLYSVEAFQYILDHYDEFNPRIRVVKNSWGDPAGTPYDPNSVQSKLIDKLVEKGVTMVFAAGNSGGTGQADRTSSTCKSPTPGVICVANYDDGAGATSGTGTRNGTLNGDGTDLSAHSSRGVEGSPATYPDISAPGTFYTAACLRIQPVCATGIVNETRWGGVYASISGTSMATPHTVGVAALLLQARPDLTPAEIEDLLQDTAYKYAFNTTQGANAAILPGPYEADPQNPGGTISYDKGAGLIDVPAALQALGVAHDGGATPQGQALLHVDQPADGAEFDGSAPIAVAGTAADGVVQPAPPAERVLLSGDGGDLANGPGAADIESLSVQETPAGASPGGLTYRLALRDAADFAGAVPSVSYRVTQNVDGFACQTNVSATPLGVTATAGTCAATSASRTGNVVNFFVPYANLGNPTPGSPAYTLFASAFVNVIVDVAPSAGGPAAADLNERPMFAGPYTVARPQATQVPTAAVTVSVDGGAERGATLTGSSPDYDWTAPAIDPAPLANGTHTLTARLYLNGVVRATNTSSFTIQRPVRGPWSCGPARRSRRRPARASRRTGRPRACRRSGRDI